MLLKSLSIQNFRLLGDFSVPALRRINLIVGANNAGKSSILEAVRIFATGAVWQLLMEIAREHGEPIKYSADEGTPLPLTGMFPDRSPPQNGTPIRIGEVDATSELAIRFGYIFETTEEIGESEEILRRRRFVLPNDIDSAGDLETRPALEISKDGTKRLLTLDLPPTLGSRRPPQFDSSTPCAVIPTRQVDLDELADIWDQVGLSEEKQHVVDALRIIEPDFQDLLFVKELNRAGSRTAMVGLKGKARAIPLSSMGDGMSRVLQRILKLLAAKNGFLLIDEFDNGLHYKIQRKLWHLMFELAQKFNVQIFATSHSWDCICSFAQAALEHQGDGMLFKVGRSVLPDDAGKIIAVCYDAEQLAALTEADMEVR